MSERLSEYRAERDFDRTDEPSGTTPSGTIEVPSTDGPRRFVIQHHDASSEHSDFRLEDAGAPRRAALLVEHADDRADARHRPTSTQPESVLSGYTVRQVADLMTDGRGES